MSTFHEFYTYIESVHDTENKFFVECVPDSVKTARYSADGWEFEAEDIKISHEGQVLHEISETIEKLKKKPERKKKVKESSAVNAKKEPTHQKNCTNETFQ